MKTYPIDLAFRQKINALEDSLREGGTIGDVAFIPINGVETLHHLLPNVYVREARLPAGTVLTGRIHTTEHLCIVVGDCEIMSQVEEGRFVGWNTFKSLPGAKRAVWARQDTIFCTVHHNPLNITDPDALQAYYSTETWAEFDGLLEALP